MSKRSLLVAVALMAAACVPGPAGGEDALPGSARSVSAHLVVGPVVRVPGTTVGGDRPAVVVDDAGTTTAVWRQSYRDSDGTRVHVMLAARRSIGGRWSEPRTIGCPPPEECAGKHPQVGVNRAGVVTAAWSDGTTVMAVRRPVGDPWGPARVVGSARDPWGWDLAVSRNGEVVIVWDTHPRGSHRQVEAVIRPARGSWRDPVPLGRGYRSEVATSATGAAVVVSARGQDDNLWAVRYLPGHGWSAWQRLARRGVEGTAVAMGPKGRALVIRDVTDANGVYGREMTRQGRWERWRKVSLGDDAAWGGVPVIDTTGAETVAYLAGYRQHGGEYYGDDGKVSRTRPGERWHACTLVPNSGAWSRQLVVNRRNDLALAFGRHTLLRPHGTTWSAPVRSHNGVLAVLADGSAMRLWWDDRGLETQRVHVS